MRDAMLAILVFLAVLLGIRAAWISFQPAGPCVIQAQWTVVLGVPPTAGTVARCAPGGRKGEG
jgi:hypothetical protein